MIRNAAFVLLASILFAGSYACSYKPEDHVSQGPQGPASPAESGDHGANAYNRPPYSTDAKQLDAEHETAGLTGPVSNGFVDHTMEDSGNLAWQGSYERAKRAQEQAR